MAVLRIVEKVSLMPTYRPDVGREVAGRARETYRPPHARRGESRDPLEEPPVRGKLSRRRQVSWLAGRHVGFGLPGDVAGASDTS